jgi:hypothetical protein
MGAVEMPAMGMSLLLIAVCVLLFLAAFGWHWARFPRVHFGWMGMALWCLSILVPLGPLWSYRLGIEWLLVILLVLVIIVLLVRPRAP